MNGMTSSITSLQRSFCGMTLALSLMAGVASGQSSTASGNSAKADDKKSEKSTDATKSAKTNKTDTVPTSQTVGDDAGNFTIVSSIEFGYRGQRVDGDVNKFKSDLNYKAGPRLFDTSFLMKAKNGG